MNVHKSAYIEKEVFFAGLSGFFLKFEIFETFSNDKKSTKSLTLFFYYITPGPSKLENVADPCSGPRGPLPKIGVLYLNLIFGGSPLVSNLNHAYC